MKENHYILHPEGYLLLQGDTRSLTIYRSGEVKYHTATMASRATDAEIAEVIRQVAQLFAEEPQQEKEGVDFWARMGGKPYDPEVINLRYWVGELRSRIALRNRQIRDLRRALRK